MVSFCAVLNLIESVSEGFPTYYYQFLPILVVQVMMFKRKKKKNNSEMHFEQFMCSKYEAANRKCFCQVSKGKNIL